MTLFQKVRAVENLYARLDKDIKKYSESSKLHCLSGCGQCCTKPDIDATILEFLPVAMHYYMEGRAVEMLEKLRGSGSVCHIFSLINPRNQSGFCSDYVHRGLVCRLFGFSARKVKGDILQLYTCSLMKKDQPEEFIKATAEINKSGKVPIVSNYYQRLNNIDAELTDKFYPINVAISKAIETIMHYYAYRRPPRGMKRVS